MKKLDLLVVYNILYFFKVFFNKILMLKDYYNVSDNMFCIDSSVLKALYSLLIFLMKLFVALKGGIPLYFATFPGPAL